MIQLNKKFVKKILLSFIVIIYFVIFMDLLFLYPIKMVDPFLETLNNNIIDFNIYQPFQNLSEWETLGLANSIGLRSKEYPYKKNNGTFRIVMLGDSYTFGYGLRLNDTWSYRLEDLLNLQFNKSVEIINLGIAGFSTKHEYEMYMRYGKNYSPDLVILNYFPNDPEICYVKNTRMDFFSFLASKIFNINPILENHGSMEQYLYKLHTSFNPCWEEVEKYVDLIYSESVTNNQSFMIVFLGLGYLNNSITKTISSKIESLADEEDISFLSVVDVLSLYPDRIMSDNLKIPHYSAFANDLIAEKMFDTIVAEGFLDDK